MESKLLIKDRDVVIPGEVLAEGMDYLPGMGSYRSQKNNNQILACQLGFVNVKDRVVRVIPLTGKYQANDDDLVIGKVYDLTMNGWLVDVNSPYSAMLPLREVPEYIERGADLSRYYNFGDVIIAKVAKYFKGKGIDLSMKGQGLRKITGGRIINVTPSKVPRIIGKQGSMISLIKEKTGCNIIVGQNGRVWIKGESHENELKAVEAILKVEHESHTEGLTEKIGAFLEGGKK